MDLGLGNRRAVVLASTQGLGAAAAEALLAEGARVAICGRDRDRLESTLGRLGRAYGEKRVIGSPLDVTDRGALVAFLRSVEERFQRIDILITNAGGPPPGAAAAVDAESLERAYHLTLRSAIDAIRTVLPGMRERRHGRVLAMTSIAVRQPIPGLALSNTLRAGLTGFLKTLAAEVAAEGALVNSICTGFFDTDRLAELFEARAKKTGRTPEEERERAESAIPTGRIGSPGEFGSAVAFLVSDRASYLNGVALPLDGGLSSALF